MTTKLPGERLPKRWEKSRGANNKPVCISHETGILLKERKTQKSHLLEIRHD